MPFFPLILSSNMIWPNLGVSAFSGPVDPSSRCVDLSQEHELVWMLVHADISNPTPVTSWMDCMPYEVMPKLYNNIAHNGFILTRGLSAMTQFQYFSEIYLNTKSPASRQAVGPLVCLAESSRSKKIKYFGDFPF